MEAHRAREEAEDCLPRSVWQGSSAPLPGEGRPRIIRGPPQKRRPAAGRRSGPTRFNRGGRGADLFRVDSVRTVELPPLTGSALFDPWRIRYRRQLAGEDLDVLADGDAPAADPQRGAAVVPAAARAAAWSAEVPTEHGYVLDFFCAAAQLAVEVDGGYHRVRRSAAR